MALVRVNDIGHGEVFGTHHVYDLVGLVLPDPRVVGSLADKQRSLDFVRIVNRGTFFEQFSALFRPVVSNPRCPELHLRGQPVRRDAL